MSLGGGETQTPVAGSNKYAQIMELMRLRQSMNPGSSYTGGFNAPSSGSASAAPQSTYDEILRLQALNNFNRNLRDGGRGDPQGDGFVSESPMAGRGPSTFAGQLALGLDQYGSILGGMLPFGFAAKGISQAMMPSATINEAKANQALLASLIAADPSYGGGGYGTSVASGGYGVTSPTGAGIAANPMGIDPATAQGQQAYSGGYSSAPSAAESSGGGGGVSAPSGGMSGYGGSAVSAGGTSSAPGQGPGYGGGYEGGGGFGDGVGGGFGGNDGSGAGFGGIYSRGGYVNKKHLKGPNPMGPDDGYGGLDDGEFVINAKSVGKYGIELMNAINAGKISKGKLRGLLEA